MTRLMATLALGLASQLSALAAGPKTDEGMTAAKALYRQAALACEKKDFKGCLEQLRKAIASSEEAILWANDNKADDFASIMFLDEDSPVRREFLERIDLANYDRALRRDIQAKCQQAAKEGKRVLLDFYGGW